MIKRNGEVVGGGRVSVRGSGERGREGGGGGGKLLATERGQGAGGAGGRPRRRTGPEDTAGGQHHVGQPRVDRVARGLRTGGGAGVGDGDGVDDPVTRVHRGGAIGRCDRLRDREG